MFNIAVKQSVNRKELASLLLLFDDNKINKGYSPILSTMCGPKNDQEAWEETEGKSGKVHRGR